MTLTRTLPTQNPSGLPLADERRIVAGMLARNADGTARPGILPAHTNALVAGRATAPLMAYDVAPFVAATSRSNSGAELIANDATVTVATTAAPGSNSRIDVIWVRSQFALFSDASNDPVFGVTQGAVAAIPVKPAIPAGALELGSAVITSTTTQTSTAAFTHAYPFTAMAGGCVLLRSQAEQDAFTPQPGLEVWRMDTQQRLVYMPNATTPGWFHTGGRPTFTVLTFAGIYSAGSPAARVVESGGRISLEGVVVSTTANFAAGTYYQVGTIPADKAPVNGIQYAATLNGVFGGVSISNTGAVSFFSSVAFTGALNLYLAGATWPDKKL